jgi:hypothetical protein
VIDPSLRTGRVPIFLDDADCVVARSFEQRLRMFRTGVTKKAGTMIATGSSIFAKANPH